MCMLVLSLNGGYVDGRLPICQQANWIKAESHLQAHSLNSEILKNPKISYIGSIRYPTAASCAGFGLLLSTPASQYDLSDK